jgi:hypothetical protein
MIYVKTSSNSLVYHPPALRALCCVQEFHTYPRDFLGRPTKNRFRYSLPGFLLAFLDFPSYRFFFRIWFRTSNLSRQRKDHTQEFPHGKERHRIFHYAPYGPIGRQHQGTFKDCVRYRY